MALLICCIIAKTDTNGLTFVESVSTQTHLKETTKTVC